MKVLVVGQGAREHALVRALKLSPSVTEVHAWPGNAGMVSEALCHAGEVGDSQALIKLVQKTSIDLVVIGPEQPLAEGLADELRSAGVACFGPSRQAAQLEASKIFAKEFMTEAGVPTSRYQAVTSVSDLKEVLSQFSAPFVLKADGLAAGKGVVICGDEAEALRVGKEILQEKTLGTAGERLLVEEYQAGYELSFLCLTEGQSYQLLPLAQDHKRLKDSDAGPNTGGMGAVAPIGISSQLMAEIEQSVIEPSIRQLKAMGMLFRGILYIGVMVTDKGPMVLEYNVRFGDPEAQVTLPLLAGDWGEVFLKVARGDLPQLKWRPLAAACVVLAAENYPQKPVQGAHIQGDVFYQTASSYFLHGGTARDPQTGTWLTQGGRVLNAVGLGSDLREALHHAYEQAESVSWPGLQKRSDIGHHQL